jgi:hypothetical protein
MTPERFVHLADAYGADLQHWPAAERDEAQALVALGATWTLAALREASLLDSQLDIYRVEAPDPLLIRRIVADAISPPQPSFWSRYAEWLSRIGFVGVGLAGVATGMLVVSLSLPLTSTPDVLPSVFDQGDADLVLSIDVEDTQQ